MLRVGRLYRHYSSLTRALPPSPQ